MNNTKVTTICNSKGGIGKTATTLAFTYRLASKGYKVLAVDIDRGANLTKSFGRENEDNPAIFDWLVKNEDVRVKITENIDLIPATFDSVKDLAEKCRANMAKPSGYLVSGLSVYDDYDFVFIDTPTGGMCYEITNALMASDNVIIPSVPDFLSKEGMKYMKKAIEEFYEINPCLNLTGVIVNNVETSTALHKKVMKEIEEYAMEEDIPLYSNFVRHSTYVGQRMDDHKDFFFCPSKNPAAQDFMKIVDEFLEKIGE